ncbi:MAG: ABC transporter permease [Armatimonadota bacterium]|nr:ABC transporter permease [Armatimonadota bacterium]MDR7533414.1 ABC transporter permease [Armatimonadota bacterium]MDR7535218.1 ABC transporter permease [Armatimonadota bacterium]
MKAYLTRRVLVAVPSLLAVTVLIFVAMRVVPGDPAVLLAGDFATPDTVAALRARWGLDRPLVVQYAVFMARLVRGDLGESIVSDLPVLDEILQRFRVTVVLALAAISVAVLVGLSAGILGATRPYSGWDYGSMVLALVGVSTPIFWSGMLLILLFAVRLGWLPTGGVGSWQNFILPAVSLGFFAAGIIARQTRAAMLDVLRQDYIRTARAKGVGEPGVIQRHALRNALIPVVTIVGLEFGRLLGGAVLTETVFSLPGLGSFLVVSIFKRDYPVIQGVVLWLALAFVLINMLVDVVYAALDPRIHYA